MSMIPNAARKRSAEMCCVTRAPTAAPGINPAAKPPATVQSMWPSAQWVARVGMARDHEQVRAADEVRCQRADQDAGDTTDERELGDPAVEMARAEVTAGTDDGCRDHRRKRRRDREQPRNAQERQHRGRERGAAGTEHPEHDPDVGTRERVQQHFHTRHHIPQGVLLSCRP